MKGTNLTDLQTRGFVVVPSFLSKAEVEECRDDFAHQPSGTVPNYNHSVATEKANARLKHRIDDVLSEVGRQTDLRVDHQWGAIYFATKRGINFPWHQDHEAYFSFQDHYDYLNFYIPIVKPIREKSNLSIVPFDVLARECPKTYPRLVRNGASRFVRLGQRRLVFLDDRGSVHLLERDIEELAHTPMLGPGDLLLMRGDVIHRTQDTDTDRVALSFRASNSHAVVERSRLADGSLYKARMMAKNAGRSQAMFTAFDAARTDRLEAHELLRLMSAVTVDPIQDRRAFMRYLLGQKRRAGVLGRFFPRALACAMVSRLATLSERFAPRAKPVRS